MEDHGDHEDHYGPSYQSWGDLDFSIITSRFRWLPLLDDDLWLGMQAMNVGIADFVVTQMELSLLEEYFEIEKTPTESAMGVSALSQMWVYGLYEVLRMWRDRRYQFKKLFDNGGVELKLASLPDDDPLNSAISIRRTQLERYRDSGDYRQKIEETWQKLEPVFRMAELYRINLAKHCAPGKDLVIPRAPGYGRINMMCGAMDYELIDRDGYYQHMNRRDIADALRTALAGV